MMTTILFCPISSFPSQPNLLTLTVLFFFPPRFTNLLNVGEFSSQLSFIFTQHTCWGKGILSTPMLLMTLSLSLSTSDVHIQLPTGQRLLDKQHVQA